MIMFYISMPRDHKHLPSHYTFLQKHLIHHQRHIQIFATIGLVIQMFIEKKNFRAMDDLAIALRKYDFIQAINRCKNKTLISNLKEAVSSSIRKIQTSDLVQELADRLKQVPRVVKIEEILFLAERYNSTFWDEMTQTHHASNLQLQLNIVGSYLKRANGRKKALTLYNQMLKDQKQDKREVVELIRKSFTQQVEADFLQKEGYYRGEQYDSRILAEWQNIEQMLKNQRKSIDPILS